MHGKTLSLLLATLLLAACGKPAPPPPAPAAAQPDAPPAALSAGLASAWNGRWTGPEGTYLEVLQDGPSLTLAIQNLDGVRRFDAIEIDGGLVFERDGVREMVKAGNGADTGMKWLQDKTRCLVVKAGEGYCRQ